MAKGGSAHDAADRGALVMLTRAPLPGRAKTRMMPQLSASASVKDGLLTITCSNASPTDEMELDILLKDFDATGVRGRILSGSMDMYNDFTSAPAEVRPLEGLTLTGSRVSVHLPACAVAEITLG